mmetsp:Transcript_24112/g.41284  ORF Transcript_24112/g.41284 Transcript_24112/m.41284 type:complete len:125 (+) Transcript_24112:124-498(+)|eukprot:CAMPEP_0183710172 /NCGR_PEP_ID=MMETSP0737-20130205/5986_1 /TAXON_ID=385413 /ORGANISM="Thalassiosira miniscula, Strain CCMP1093" /LENGTH=124 /DNA_ID=CAMNT_0025938395 /DNA_START=69 /DNA_END=443 /DNA_ORIENTATION=+
MDSMNDSQQSSTNEPLPPVSRQQQATEDHNESNVTRSLITRRTIQKIIKNTLATTGVLSRGHVIRARRHRLTFVATSIERQLYIVAPSYEDYANLDTLNKRMAWVLTSLIVREQHRTGVFTYTF